VLNQFVLTNQPVPLFQQIKERLKRFLPDVEVLAVTPDTRLRRIEFNALKAVKTSAWEAHKVIGRLRGMISAEYRRFVVTDCSF
jgi:hypothetical protein